MLFTHREQALRRLLLGGCLGVAGYMLLAFLSQPGAILGGSLPLYVDGYCDSLDSEKENLRVAAVRSNRVKSELIVRQGLTEDCFVTENHSGGGALSRGARRSAAGAGARRPGTGGA